MSFIGYSNEMNDVCSSIVRYNPEKQHQVLIIFDDVVADMISNNNFAQ